MDTHLPIEDISIILSRFQAWTGAQPAGKPKDGVRELTYEEAIGVRRYREPVHNELPTSRTKYEEEVESTTGSEKAAAKSEARLRDLRNAKVRKKTAIVRHSAAQTSISRPPHEFRQVLAESITVPPIETATALTITRRPLSISIRVSAAEQALIKARSVEANVSVSAYLRQCALEIERLRAQATKPFASAAQRTPAPRPGLLSRLIQRLFEKKTTALTLRA